MAEKVFITDNNVATLTCPECNKTTTVDVGKYTKLERLVKLNVTCKCGKPYSVVLERRKYFRKQVKLPGTYAYRSPNGMSLSGTILVTDISRVGLKLRFKQPPDFEIGATFDVEFKLDDKQNSVIKKEVIAKRISDCDVNTEFSSISTSDPSDKALGFYLF